MKIIRLITFISTTLMLCGCVGLPIPHTRTTFPEVSGKLCFNNNSKGDVPMTYRYDLTMLDGESRSGLLTTDDSGFFNIPEERKWHFIYWIPLLPLDCGWGCSIEVFHADDLVYSNWTRGICSINPTTIGPVNFDKIGANSFEKELHENE